MKTNLKFISFITNSILYANLYLIYIFKTSNSYLNIKWWDYADDEVFFLKGVKADQGILRYDSDYETWLRSNMNK